MLDTTLTRIGELEVLGENIWIESFSTQCCQSFDSFIASLKQKVTLAIYLGNI